MARTPDEIMTDFHAAVTGTADLDPVALLWEILEDVQDSYKLAGASTETQITVSDYLANHYGE